MSLKYEPASEPLHISPPLTQRAAKVCLVRFEPPFRYLIRSKTPCPYGIAYRRGYSSSNSGCSMNLFVGRSVVRTNSASLLLLLYYSQA